MKIEIEKLAKIFLIAIVSTQILSLGFLVGTAEAEWAEHLVISAVQITEGEGKTNHDFIEIYNPTASDINLKGYRLVKRTKVGTSDTSIKSWTDDAIIKAHGWRLWASSDDESYSVNLGADDATKQTIAPDNGIAIRFGALDAGEIIDSVAWGAAENIFKEGSAAPALGANESLARKPGTPGAGNGEDTNNNTGDFNVAANYISHNSQSAAEPAMENSQESSLSPTPTPNLNSEPSSSPVASVSSSSPVLPVAEAGMDKEAVIGENVDFDGSDSFDPQGKELALSWDFGDKTSAKGINVSHSYNAIGEYTVILKVDNGESVSKDTLKVKIIAPEFSDKIILSEMLPNPIGVDTDGEWIELYNSGDKKVNLKGWILATSAKSSGKQYIFSGDNFIEAKSYLVIKRSASGLVLTNESGRVSLMWPADKIMSEANYGSAKEGKSYAFVNNAWQWADIPTPGKANSAKTAVPAVSKSKDNSLLLANISENINLNDREVLNDGEELSNSASAKSAIFKNSAAQSAAGLNIEDFLNQLISEKVDNAILKAKTSEESPEEKILALADNTEKSGIAAEDKEIVCKDFCLNNEKNVLEDSGNVRNNPWFYGDLVLSALSLFLVWRYQEVRKRLKN